MAQHSNSIESTYCADWNVKWFVLRFWKIITLIGRTHLDCDRLRNPDDNGIVITPIIWFDFFCYLRLTIFSYCTQFAICCLIKRSALFIIYQICIYQVSLTHMPFNLGCSFFVIAKQYGEGVSRWFLYRNKLSLALKKHQFKTCMCIWYRRYKY